MHVKTERGIITIEAEYLTEERCLMDGYTFAFYSTELDRNIYSMCLDDRGLKHSFALVEGL